MKSKIILHTVILFFLGNIQVSRAQYLDKRIYQANDSSVMSNEYYKFWDQEVQSKIDHDIELYRKADAKISIKNIPPGTSVSVRQMDHIFLFGGNIFLFGDLKSKERNDKYERIFGDLFNAATIAFYWKTLEPEPGKPRYQSNSSYEYRRPPTDPVVAFCESKGINMNGHAIIYGMRRWGHPEWMPEERRALEPVFEKHVSELAERYKGRIQRWDVVNESIDQANRGIMPDDYTYKTFRWAMKYFPESVMLNINDCDIHSGPSKRYVEIIRDLTDRGIRIDYAGLQMHIFNPRESQKIAEGADILTPEKIYAVLDCLADAQKPIHISEVTISAPDETLKGMGIQAEITRNLYRLWFSYPKIMGITWWNVVDGGAAPGEPSFSGLCDKEMNPKPAYNVLDKLINHEWTTDLTIKADEDGFIKFRGFKGRYLISWKDKHGNERESEFLLRNDGDGLEISK